MILRKLGQTAEATDVLLRSVRAYPVNWSTWLELIHCCSGGDQVSGAAPPTPRAEVLVRPGRPRN